MYERVRVCVCVCTFHFKIEYYNKVESEKNARLGEADWNQISKDFFLEDESTICSAVLQSAERSFWSTSKNDDFTSRKFPSIFFLHI
jgi:hypothetical protein